MKAKTLFAMTAIGAMALGMVAAAPSMDPKEKTPAPAPTAEPKKVDGAAVGSAAPDFTLTDTDGKTVKFSEIAKDKIVVIEWFNPECPFVKKHHEKNPTFANLFKEFSPKGVVFLAINSGAPGKEGAGKEISAKFKKDWKIEYPVLIDESGDVGRAYGAKVTPHMFIVGKDGKVAYNGAIDNDRSAAKPGDVNYVRKALNEILTGSSVTEASNAPYGCSVKYGAKK